MVTPVLFRARFRRLGLIHQTFMIMGCPKCDDRNPLEHPLKTVRLAPISTPFVVLATWDPETAAPLISPLYLFSAGDFTADNGHEDSTDYRDGVLLK